MPSMFPALRSSSAATALAPMLRASRHRRRRQRRERPPPHWFTLGSLRSFGKRLWNPPPPVEGERYAWLVTPRYNILLEDVVTDKHLPPLSRQDFEDYLRHAEGTVANLYFRDWVYHYRQHYKQWADSVLPTAGAGIPSSSKGLYRSRDLWERLKDCQDRQLREEFALAKATFFEPTASMRLNIDDALRNTVLLIPNGPPPQGEQQELTDKLPSFPNQPEPSIFDAILSQVDAALNVALARFLKLAFCNSGLWHSYLGHLLGMCILASGLTLWSTGIVSRRKRYIVGSLPLIWIGVWFMLVSLNGHCLGVYVTGDARQLYPHEFARPLPPNAAPPPVYSLAPVPNEATNSTYSFGRKPSAASHLLPLSSTPTLSPPPPSYQPWAHLSSGRRASEGVLKLFTRRGEDKDKPVDLEAVDRTQLPPPRKTKNLPRSSLAIDIEQANGLGPALPPLVHRGTMVDLSVRQNAVVDLSAGLEAAGFRPEAQPDSPFSEENDFGIVVSEAFEEDAPETYSYPDDGPTCPHPPTTPSPNADDLAVQQPSHSGWAALEPLAPLVQVPEYAAQRRRTMPDIFAPGVSSVQLAAVENESRRGSRSSEVEREREGSVLRSPWPRKLLGPMTLVHSPVVRRAHWVMTVRTAIIASVVTCGMTLGLLR